MDQSFYKGLRLGNLLFYDTVEDIIHATQVDWQDLNGWMSRQLNSSSVINQFLLIGNGIYWLVSVPLKVIHRVFAQTLSAPGKIMVFTSLSRSKTFVREIHLSCEVGIEQHHLALPIYEDQF